MWIYYSIILFLALLSVDQSSKVWVMSKISPMSEHALIPGFSLTNVRNSGAAWSILPGSCWLFILIGLIALLIAGYYLWKCRYDFAYETAITFFIAGALGNLISRIINGYVTDMIQTDFINFPIFNVADSLLTIGVFLLMILIGFNHPVKRRS